MTIQRQLKAGAIKLLLNEPKQNLNNIAANACAQYSQPCSFKHKLLCNHCGVRGFHMSWFAARSQSAIELDFCFIVNAKTNPSCRGGQGHLDQASRLRVKARNDLGLFNRYVVHRHMRGRNIFFPRTAILEAQRLLTLFDRLKLPNINTTHTNHIYMILF